MSEYTWVTSERKRDTWLQIWYVIYTILLECWLNKRVCNWNNCSLRHQDKSNYNIGYANFVPIAAVCVKDVFNISSWTITWVPVLLVVKLQIRWAWTNYLNSHNGAENVIDLSGTGLDRIQVRPHCYKIAVIWWFYRQYCTPLQSWSYSSPLLVIFHTLRKRRCCVTSTIARFVGPTWDPSGADRTQVGPMLAIWTLLYGLFNNRNIWHVKPLSAAKT